ncbi:hypothetical protein GCM10011581_38750 [Saccharopolyspora subtropica]|uniref:Lipoprotein with Yx(FWY)xxD motif n=2 Tax=Saccharopolyspora thermophila TaxID=89367 RepID=A0A917NFT4_9PSEU|nr:hypothetical protein GCM10011581_38750 [Saccharopolyspora subtropica]
MTRHHTTVLNSRRFRGGWLACGALSLAALACSPAESPDGVGSGLPPPPTTAAPVTGGVVVVQTHEVPHLGAVLTGPSGRTVYLFDKDRDSQPTCVGGCASPWPPLTTTGPPAAGPGVNPALLGTTRRPDGRTQIVYNGHPLYYYEGDDLPGEANGQTVISNNGTWYVVSPAGDRIAPGGGDY